MHFDTFVEQCLDGLAKKKGVKSANVNQAELAKGMKVEREHTKNKNTARTIAMDHLAEDPHYYTKLKKAKL